MSNSDLKTIEEYKRKAKELDIILDLIPGIVVYKDTKNNFIRVNKYLAEAQNMTKEEMEGKSCFDIYPLEDAQKYWDDDLEIIKSGKPKLNYEEPWESEEGSRWVSTNKIPYFDENGEAKGILAIAIDVTERKNAEEKLRKAQEQLNTIFSNLKDTVFVISEDYEILFKNENAHSIFGDDLIGRNCYEVIKGGEQVCDNCPIQKLMTSDVCQIHSEHQILSPVSNEIKIFDVITTPIDNYDGKTAYVEVLRDITEQKQLENENARKTAITKAMKEMFQITLTAKTEEEVAKICLEETQKLTRSKFGYIGEINQEGKFDTIALSNPGWELCIIPKSEAVVLIQGMEIKGYWGKAITEGHSVIVNDPAVHPDAQGTPEGHPPITSFLGVPMKQANKVIGLIGIANKEGGYDLHDQEAVESLSVALVEALMRKRAEIELGKHRDQLDNLVQERVNELNCLYGLSKIIEEKDITKEEILKKVVNIIPPAWQFSDVTCARIQLEDNEYKTKNFKETEWKQASDIFVNTNKVGSVEVYHLEKMPEFDERSFLKEERSLIDFIAERLGKDFERIEAEIKVKESEEWLSTTLKSIGDAVIATDSKGIISFLNPVAESLTGWKQSEAIKKPVQEIFKIINEESREEVESPVDRVIHEGVIVGLANHTVLISKDGREIPIDDSGAPIKDKEGKIIGVALTFRDITERRKAEKAFRDREKYTFLLEALTDGVLIIDRDWRYLIINDEVARMVQMPKEDLIGNKMTDLFPGIENTVFGKIYTQVLETGEPATAEDEFTFPDGRKIWYKVQVFPTPEGLLIIVADITNRKQAEEALKKSEEQYRTLFENAEVGMYRSTLDGSKVLAVNEKVSKILGITKEEIFSDPAFIRWEKPANRDEMISKLREYGYVRDYEIRLKAAGDEIKTVLISGNLMSEKGWFEGSLMDITERKKVEEELALSEEFLNNIIEQSPVSLWVSDSEGTLIKMNQSCRELFGATDEETVGKYNLFKDNLIKEQGFMPLVENTFEKGEVARFTIDYELPRVEHVKIIGATHRILEVIVSPIKDMQGKITNAIVQHKDITERKAGEQKLKESEEKYRNLFERTPMAILLVNFDLIIEDCNVSAEDLFGYTKEELLGVNSLYLDNIPPDTKIKLAKSFSTYLKTGVPEQTETQMHTKDGKIIWIDSFPIQVTIAEKSYILVMIQDITERKKTEEELRNREKDLHIRNELSKIFLTTSGNEMYHKILEFVKDLMQSEQGYFGYIDENGDLVCPSLTFKIWDKCQVKDKDIIFPRESWTGLWGRSLLEKKILYSNKDLNVPEGHLHLNNSIIAPIIFKEKVIGQLGLANSTSNYTEDDKKGIEDITDFIAPVLNARIEHVKAEAREKRKTDTMNSINAIFQNALTYESVEELGKVCLEVAQELSGAKFGFFGEVNKEGKFDTIAISNPGWEECKMPGSEATKIIKGMEIRGMQFLPLKDGKSRIFNDPSNHPDNVGTPKGHPKITCLLSVPFEYKGKIIGQIGLGNKPGGFNHHDQEAIETLSVAMIEALMKKRVEENIKKSQENLRVSNVSLKKTMKELKRSNMELEQFAYVASHDLQEPLRMVASFTQLLQNRYQDKLDDDANDFINYAVDGAIRMQGLISDLLVFSRVGTRGKPFKATDMNAVLEAVINTFRQSIKETSTEITYAPLPVVIADESQMIQLVQNLISNAIKFRGEETPLIHISGEVKTDKWIFSVRDNGIGMESKYFDRIFVIFQRLHKKDEYGGTGIGLAVCKKIIQRHSGKIWVESELGKGSTFYFSIQKKNNHILNDNK